MSECRNILAYLACVMLLLGITGCGGGEETSSGSNASLPAKVVSWESPTTFSDGTPLDPARDLDGFEVYVKEAGVFAESDSPLALVSAIDPGSGQITTSFNLANLGPFLSKGVLYQVSLRAVSLTGMKSGFSQSASFSF